MNLLIDAGNTRLKWALWRRGDIEPGDAIAWAEIGHLANQWQQLPRPESVMLCSVAPAAQTERVIQWVGKHWACPLHHIRTSAARAGISNAYTRPGDLGVDRWVAMIGAHHRFSGDKCVIDLGTAITLDLLSADGSHRGGLIAPGYHTMINALYASTDLSAAAPVQTELGQAGSTRRLRVARDTTEAIHYGTLHALVGLIDGARRGFADGDALLLVTGGDAQRLRPYLTPDAIHAPDLLFWGLAALVQDAQA